jgi:hypothetical protein
MVIGQGNEKQFVQACEFVMEVFRLKERGGEGVCHRMIRLCTQHVPQSKKIKVSTRGQANQRGDSLMVRAHLTIKDIRATSSVSHSHVRVRVESAASLAKFENLPQKQS